MADADSKSSGVTPVGFDPPPAPDINAATIAEQSLSGRKGGRIRCPRNLSVIDRESVANQYIPNIGRYFPNTPKRLQKSLLQ